jgi:indolepyruvate ferredoxin oxidoreductase alpha subunit
MTVLIDGEKGSRHLLMGNEAIVRGALEAGVNVASGYPGTPSSEIIENFSKVCRKRDMYVEWSVNEKVALEVAASASFAGLRSLAAMKQVGVNVAADFLLHLSQYGTRGGIVLVSCEDPGGLSSTNEGESRHYAKMMEFPLLEPGNFQEAKDMTKWAFELSEEIKNIVMIRSVTRLSHASGNVVMGSLPSINAKAEFKYGGTFFDQMDGPVINLPGIVDPLRRRQQEKLKSAGEIFEESPFNIYQGPEHPELMIMTSSTCSLYSKEAIEILNVQDRVGLLKIGTTWPLPRRLIEKYLGMTERVMVVEEVLPFLEENIMTVAAKSAPRMGARTFFGKYDGTFPTTNELNPDLVIGAISEVLDLKYQAVPETYKKRAEEIVEKGSPARALTFCPGCPHRASFWNIHNALEMDNRTGFVCGDIGCYSLAALPCGFESLKTLHAMGSGIGVASGFGKLGDFGMNQPIITVSGDSTFFHAVMPGLVNAVHNKSDVIMIVLDNSGTAMTGFQAHPGLEENALGEEVPAIDIQRVCEAMGVEVRVCDPFDLEDTQKNLLEMLESGEGVRVVIMRQICALSPEKKGKKKYNVTVDESVCIGENCGCNRFCTRIFKCPGLVWDHEKKVAGVDEVICAGCGVCSFICPSGAIRIKEAA